MRFEEILTRLIAADLSASVVGAACAYWAATTSTTHGTLPGSVERIDCMSVACEVALVLEAALSPGGVDIDGADMVRGLVGL